MIYTRANSDSFRQDTKRHDSMAGCTKPSFLCVSCKEQRLITGRKQAVKGSPKFGYVCAGCAKKGEK